MKKDFAWVPKPIRDTVIHSEECKLEKWFDVTSHWSEDDLLLALRLERVGSKVRRKLLEEEKVIEKLKAMEEADEEPEDMLALYFLSDESLKRIVTTFLH